MGKAAPTKRVKVGFYRATLASKEADGWEWPADGDVAAALVANFRAREKLGHPGWQMIRYWGRVFFVELHDDDGQIQFGVSTVRSDDLPLVLPSGGATGQPMPLAAGDNLLEPSYMTFFDDRVVGFVGGQHTPGHRMCAAALARVTRVNLALLPIPRSDVLVALKRGEGLANLDFSVASGSLDAASETEDVVKTAAELVARTPPAHTVKITLTAETEAQKRGLKRLGVRLVGQRGLGDLKSAHAYVLSNEFGSEQLNLLEAHIARTEKVEVDDRTRHLMPQPAQEAADRAYETLAGELSDAIALASDDLDDPPDQRSDGAELPSAENEPGAAGSVTPPA